jgi:2,4-didehydro-3-deoxy-L-rhamnonate hydrolase
LGIGLNYAKHAAESGSPEPEFPPTFTKFPSCITGPNATVELPSESVDWEVELVVVIGRRAHRVAAADGWSFVAGLTVGQDLSERKVQLRPPVPQFSLGKSFPGFGPTGPWLVTPDELANPDDLGLSCSLNGEVMQDSRTSDLIFSVPVLIEKLSGIIPLLPGDVIFTGTPSGVGVARKPPRFLAPGDVVVSVIEGIGTMTTTLAAGS